MSQTVSDRATGSAANHAAAQAVIAHHAHLSAHLNERIEALLHLVDSDDLVKSERARQDLLGYLRREVLPHALAEEQALYPPAAVLPEGRLLVAGMLDEHRALTALVAELADANSLVRAGAAARALGGLFATHLAKENDLVLPLLIADPTVSLADVLAGMHEILGADEIAAHAGAGAATATPDGCGGEHCGCGGEHCGCGSDPGPTSQR